VVYGVQGHEFPAHMTGLTWGVFLVSLGFWTLIALLATGSGVYQATIWGATLAAITTAIVRWQINGDMTLTGWAQHLRHDARTYLAARRANVTRDRAARPTTITTSHVEIHGEH
jgi:hypothetical protein